MSHFKRIDILKKYVLTDEVTDNVTKKLKKNTGKDDFFVVFLSVCGKKTRARVFHGTGSTLALAWSNAENNLEFARKKAVKDKKLILGTWVKADIVTNYEEIPVASLNKIIIKNQWINFARVGISMDPDFRIAFLEAELNSNGMISYYTKNELEESTYDLNSNRLSLNHIPWMCIGVHPFLT